MEGELKCKICGKIASEDSCFHKKQMLCNRHYLQMQRYGEIKSVEPIRNYIDEKDRVCCVCGDKNHKNYHIWDNEGEYKGKVVCGKHFNQLVNKGCIADETQSEHKERKAWSKEEETLFEELYKDGKPYKEISRILNRTEGALSTKASDLGLCDKYTRINNPNYKAIYQDYDWCYERYVNQRMSFEEMAAEGNTTKRTIEKWCSDIHQLNRRTIKNLLHLTDEQRQLIIAGTLGDGHIDRRDDQPMYIESHAEDEKDYLFWKYDILKNLCNKPPSYIKAEYHTFGGNKEYLCKPQYRINTKIIMELNDIKNMSRMDKIRDLTSFQISLLLLDDGSRSTSWELCVAEWLADEVDVLIDVCRDRFGFDFKKRKDTRYLGTSVESTKIIDSIILDNVPNDLDIIHKKIFKDKGRCA